MPLIVIGHPFLTWNSSLYGNVYWTVIDSSEMWLPFIVLANGVHKMEPIGGDTKFNSFIITKGEVVYSPGDVFEARCPTDISKFPFDEQQCFFVLTAWALPNEILSLSSLIKDEVLLTVSSPIFPSILIAKNLITGSLKNRSIDHLETKKKSISMKNSQFFDYLLYAKSK